MKINKELWCWLNKLYRESLFVRPAASNYELLWSTTTKPLYSQLGTTAIHVEDYHTCCEQLWSMVCSSELCRATKLSTQIPPVSLMSDSRRNQSRELEMASQLRMMRRMGHIWSWQNENENVSIFCDLRLAQADQIFMVITPNESLASEFKFRWDQKEKRFVEVIGGLMIRYEGLINGVVVSYQLIWSPDVAHHHH